MHKSAPQSDSRSPLLSLAPELRNRIYEYIVVYDEPIDFVKIHYAEDRGDGYWQGRGNDDWKARVLAKVEQATKQPALTQTCSIIRSESLPMFYALNTFNGSLLLLQYADTKATWKWLLAIGRHRRFLERFSTKWLMTDDRKDLGGYADLRRKVLSFVCEMGTLTKEHHLCWDVVSMKFKDSNETSVESVASE
ncbi:hypothetical protein LTR08_008644 [Meristemomyces frigidus]|nr:hypothetical protein LTR08_008644 [Meristemomyces frigidus]